MKGIVSYKQIMSSHIYFY